MPPAAVSEGCPHRWASTTRAWPTPPLISTRIIPLRLAPQVQPDFAGRRPYSPASCGVQSAENSSRLHPRRGRPAGRAESSRSSADSTYKRTSRRARRRLFDAQTGHGNCSRHSARSASRRQCVYSKIRRLHSLADPPRRPEARPRPILSRARAIFGFVEVDGAGFHAGAIHWRSKFASQNPPRASVANASSADFIWRIPRLEDTRAGRKNVSCRSLSRSRHTAPVIGAPGLKF